MATGTELQAKIAAHALKSPEFRESLLEDPRAAISEFVGQALPADVEINVLVEGPATAYFVLPYLDPSLVSDLDEDLLAGAILGTCSSAALGEVLGTCGARGTLAH